jgi:hypothetical protein
MILRYFTGGLAFVCFLLGLALHMERRAHAKANDRIVQLTAQLEAISTARNDQAKVSERTVEKVVTIKVPQADRVERAVLPGACKTSPEIMGADL